MREPVAGRLLDLLHAQRLAERERDRHARGSRDWEAASDRLEDLNARIWQLASAGAEPDEDSRPATTPTANPDPWTNRARS